VQPLLAQLHVKRVDAARRDGDKTGMPPAKVKIERIEGHRMRQNTFHKRKLGLIKKAIELTILCDCDCTIILRPSASSESGALSSRDGRLVSYSNVSVQRMLQECWPDIMSQPQITNAEYAKLSKDEEAVQSAAASTASAAERYHSQVAGQVVGKPMYEMMQGVSAPMPMGYMSDPRQGMVQGGAASQGDDAQGGAKLPVFPGLMHQHQRFNTIANFMSMDPSQSQQILQGFNQPQVLGHPGAQQGQMPAGAGMQKSWGAPGARDFAMEGTFNPAQFGAMGKGGAPNPMMFAGAGSGQGQGQAVQPVQPGQPGQPVHPGQSGQQQLPQQHQALGQFTAVAPGTEGGAPAPAQQQQQTVQVQGEIQAKAEVVNKEQVGEGFQQVDQSKADDGQKEQQQYQAKSQAMFFQPIRGQGLS